MSFSAPVHSLSSLAIQQLRKAYEQHVSCGGKAEEFASERMRPKEGLAFAFIGRTPKRNSSASYYRCSFCETDRKFSAGNVIVSADGCLRLIGPECWEAYFDTEEYQAQKLDLQDYELREWFALHRERISLEIEKARPRVRTVAYASQSLLDLAQNLPRVMAGDKSGLSEMLRRIRRDGGRLAVEASVPDEIAGKDEKGRYLHYRLERTIIHQVAGLEAIFPTLAETDLISLAKEAYESIRDASEAISQIPSKAENTTVAKAVRSVQKKLNKAARNLVAIKTVMAHAQSFLAPANLHGIARWSQHGDCSDDTLARAIEFDGNELTVITSDPVFTLSMPSSLAGFTVPDLDEIRRIMKTI